MAGPNLELAKFSLYVMFPIAIMSYFGDPDWYNRFVYPLKAAFVHSEKPKTVLAETQSELQEQLAVLRQQRLERKQRREEGNPSSGSALKEQAKEVQRLV